MKNRIAQFRAAAPDAAPATTALAFCDAIWHLHIDPCGLQEWEIDSPCQLEVDAVKALRSTRVIQP